MNIPAQELELIESIKYLDANQKTDALRFIKEQLMKTRKSFVKKEALKEIRRALKKR